MTYFQIHRSERVIFCCVFLCGFTFRRTTRRWSELSPPADQPTDQPRKRNQPSWTCTSRPLPKSPTRPGSFLLHHLLGVGLGVECYIFTLCPLTCDLDDLPRLLLPQVILTPSASSDLVTNVPKVFGSLCEEKTHYFPHFDFILTSFNSGSELTFVASTKTLRSHRISKNQLSLAVKFLLPTKQIFVFANNHF